MGLSGTTTPLPHPTPISGVPMSPRSDPRTDAMRRHYDDRGWLRTMSRRDYDSSMYPLRNPYYDFYGMRESQYYPNYGRGNY